MKKADKPLGPIEGMPKCCDDPDFYLTATRASLSLDCRACGEHWEAPSAIANKAVSVLSREDLHNGWNGCVPGWWRKGKRVEVG